MSRSMKLLAAGLTAALLWAPGQIAMADTSITASNQSEDSEIETGDVESKNSSSGHVGHQGGGSTQVGADDIDNEEAVNVQEGDNEVDAEQSANTRSGDGVAGQVIGGVSSGDLSVDATNLSEGVEVTTGDATSENDFAAFVGLSGASETSVGASDIDNASATNVQEGDNEVDLSQDSDAATGDAVGGQVFGAVASGSADVVLANTSEDADATSGDSEQSADADFFTGLAAVGFISI
jgi:hypothetical protein